MQLCTYNFKDKSKHLLTVLMMVSDDKKINLEILVISFLAVMHVSDGISSLDVMLKNSTVAKLNLRTNSYEFYEAVNAALDNVDLELWCAVQCSEKNFCYFSSEIEDKCVLCVTAGTNADSTMQAYTGPSPPDSTQVYYKQGKTWQREYEIGNLAVTFDVAVTTCADLGMQLVTFASVQEFETVTQQISASPENGGMFWIDLTRQQDGTWVYGDGGPDFRDIWMASQPNGVHACAHMWGGTTNNYKLNNCDCVTCGGRKYVCMKYVLV